MLKSFTKALGLVAGLLMSAAACAVSMGGINVTTALGEPLSAEIALDTVGKAERDNLSARLASPDVFKGAGMEYPSALAKLKFQIETRANGERYIKMTTDQPVNEPFVSILVELSWTSGRLLREYTFLLDPPGFKPELPKAPEVKPVLSRVEVPAKPAPVPTPVDSAASGSGAIKDAFPPMRVAAPVDEKAPVAVVTAVKLTETTLPAANVATGTIKVKRGDTLSKVAAEVKPADISLERMLVALYNANADAFDGRNMNRLRTGKILRVPESEALNKVGQADAEKEIRMQAADWNVYRQKLAAASGSVAEHAPRQESVGKISTVVADKTPPARESAKEVVRLSKGEAPGDKAVAGGNTKALQDKLHTLEEEAVARNKTLGESNERIAMLEKNIRDMQRLIELKTQSIATAKPEAKTEAKPEAEKEVAEAKSAVPAHTGASGVQAAKPAVAPKVQAQPSLLDMVLDEPLYLAGGAAALLALGGIGFMRARRNRTTQRSVREEDLPAHIVAPVMPSPDTGDYTQAAPAAHVASIPEPEDVDPISEADLFLNFGREAQAEEILKDALRNSPDNQRVRLKLLSIYANRKDLKNFAPLAHQVQDSGDTAAWAQAAEMGRKLEPGNPLYGGDESVVAVAEAVPAEAPAEQAPAELDFDLDFGTPGASAAGHEESTAKVDIPLEATAGEAPSGLDFDLGHEATAQAAFDVAGQEAAAEPGVPEEKKIDPASVLDFDLGLEVPAPSAKEEYSSTMSLDVPLDMDVAGQEAQSSPQAAGDQMFDVTTPLTPASVVEEMAAAEALTGEEDNGGFVLDFPVSDETDAEEKTGAAPAQAVTKGADALNLGEINLNLEEPAAPAAETKDAHWYDVATKLDLARAYQEMGDSSGAREILEEVLKEGDAQQRAAAEAMIQQLSV